ncbi:MAG: non-canonical purine NTP diphosphatase [Bacteroidales bacterium]|nr:non-canonical purine NTP diphosphatase [Bacteroidales bacterium]
METLIIATHNKHKLQEIQNILQGLYEVKGLSDIGCTDEIPETGNNLKTNALQKASYVKEHYGYDCFADDTGLEVDALNGAPGVYSARYAGEHCSFDDNVAKMLREMEGKTQRNARFCTVVALIKNGETHYFEGVVEGEILTERHGNEGFGYDPIFRPKGYEKSFAELTTEEKNAISHRGRAVAKLIDFLKQQK